MPPIDGSFDEIRYRQEGHLAVITLARPERRNALTKQMRAEIIAAMSAASETARAVLIDAEPPAFCAGQDLDELRAVEDVGAMLEAEYAPLFNAVADAPVPVVAAIAGAAAGAGLHLALACDMALAARSAKFVSPFAKIALTPSGGGSWFLPRRIGHARALGFALSGAPIDAATAEQWGMIWRAVDDDTLAAEARALAQQLADGPTRAFALTKSLLAESWRADSLDAQMRREAQIQAEAAAGADHREGVAAFLEKRRPAFTGS